MSEPLRTSSAQTPTSTPRASGRPAAPGSTPPVKPAAARGTPTPPTTSAKPSGGTSTAPNPIIVTGPEPWPRSIVYGAIAAAAVILIGVGLIIWKPWRSREAPRLNESLDKIASFTGSSAFTKLPFDRQLVYLKQMDEKETDLVESFRAGRMSEKELATALEAAYLGRHLARMKNYYEKPTPKEKEAYLDKALDKKEREKRGIPRITKEGVKKMPKPDARDAADVKDINRDESIEPAIIKTWPAEIQQHWNDYHAAMENRKKARKEQEKKDMKAFIDFKARGGVLPPGGAPGKK